MIITQDTFVCKPGNASKLAKTFKEAMADDSHLKYVLTDLTGQFHRIVMVSEYQDLTNYEAVMKSYSENTERNQKMSQAMAGVHEMYISGSREIFKVW